MGRQQPHLAGGARADLPAEAATSNTLPSDPNHLLLACREGTLARTLPCDSVRLTDIVQGLQAEKDGVRDRAHAANARVRLEGRAERRARKGWGYGEDAVIRGDRVGGWREEGNEGALVLGSFFVAADVNIGEDLDGQRARAVALRPETAFQAARWVGIAYSRGRRPRA